MKIPFSQVDFKTHQRYNRLIDKLLSLGRQIYVTAYLPRDSYKVQYKVSLSLLEARTFGQSVYVLSVSRFKLGYSVPRSFWGKVESDAMLALQADEFIQLLYRLCEEPG